MKEITWKGKKKGRLTPTTFSLLHATDFADRYERNIFPLIRAGYIVLTDRYVYTAYARDVVRGCSYKWVCKVYDFAVKPDLIFYFSSYYRYSALTESSQENRKLKYYEAGMDLNFSNDEYESYRLFQSRIIDQYESMIDEEGFTVIDGTEDIEQQQAADKRKDVKTDPPTADAYRTCLGNRGTAQKFKPMLLSIRGPFGP